MNHNYENLFGCVHCKYLEINNLPIDKWKCTHKLAFTPNKIYPNGIEYEKEWIRQDDIKRELNYDKSLPLPKQDVNLYFMCFYFKEKNKLKK